MFGRKFKGRQPESLRRTIGLRSGRCSHGRKQCTAVTVSRFAVGGRGGGALSPRLWLGIAAKELGQLSFGVNEPPGNHARKVFLRRKPGGFERGSHFVDGGLPVQHS